MSKKNRKKTQARTSFSSMQDKIAGAMASVKPETKPTATPAVPEKKDVVVKSTTVTPAPVEVKKEAPKPIETKPVAKPVSKLEPKKETPAVAKPDRKSVV